MFCTHSLQLLHSHSKRPDFSTPATCLCVHLPKKDKYTGPAQLLLPLSISPTRTVLMYLCHLFETSTFYAFLIPTERGLLVVAFQVYYPRERMPASHTLENLPKNSIILSHECGNQTWGAFESVYSRSLIRLSSFCFYVFRLTKLNI